MKKLEKVRTEAHDLQACNLKLFSLEKARESDFRTPSLCPNMDKIRSKLHARENAQATLQPNKENFKLKKTSALNQSETL